MKTMKKLLGIAVLLAVLVGCLVFHASAATVVDSGYCGGEGAGRNLSWTLDSEGALTISGVGAMEDYAWESNPWYNLRSSIKAVKIGDDVASIGDYAFHHCDSLTTVTIGNSVTNIGDSAFSDCFSLTSVEIPDSVTSVGRGAFFQCYNLTAVTFGGRVTTIGKSAFSCCSNLASVEIPDSVTSIGNSAFWGCSSLTSVNIPDGVTIIGFGTFQSCLGLTTVTIPDSVTTIENCVFEYCQGLSTVTIPTSVTKIYGYAFRGCYNLETVYFEGNAPRSIFGASEGSPSFDADTVTLYYAPGATGWTDSDAYNVSAGTWNGYKLQAWGMGDIESVGFYGNSLSLEGLVYINHYATVSGDVDRYYVQANGGLLIWRTKPALADATFEKAEIRKTGLVWDETYQAYRQQTDGIPAKEFADELYLRTYVKTADGEYVYGALKEYSVQDYCESRIKNSTNEKMKALAAAMLHYGASAQTYFDYHTNDLANKTITWPVDTWNANLLDPVVNYTVAPTKPATGDVKNVGQTLSLEGTVLVNYYFNPASGQMWNVVGGELQIWDDGTDLSGKPSYTKVLAYDTKQQAWRGQSEGFVAKQYSKTIYARAKFVDENGNEHYSKVVTYNPETYAKSRINNSTNPDMVELAKRLVMYGERARVYFG